MAASYVGIIFIIQKIAKKAIENEKKTAGEQKSLPLEGKVAAKP